MAENINIEKNKEKIKIVNGNGSNLDISPVYTHISKVKPKNKDSNPKNIVVPNSKESKKEK